MQKKFAVLPVLVVAFAMIINVSFQTNIYGAQDDNATRDVILDVTEEESQDFDMLDEMSDLDALDDDDLDDIANLTDDDIKELEEQTEGMSYRQKLYIAYIFAKYKAQVAKDHVVDHVWKYQAEYIALGGVLISLAVFTGLMLYFTKKKNE